MKSRCSSTLSLTRQVSKIRALSLIVNNRAFTLLEVMIAVAIIAIAFVSLLGSQSRSLALATEAQFNTIAPMLASLKLAEIERGVVDLENNEGDFGEDFPGYKWKELVETANFENHKELNALEKPLKRLELNVSWEGTPYSYVLVYYGQWQD